MSLKHSIPILGIRDDGLLMADWSVSLFFRFAPIPMEGMTDRERRQFTDRAEAFLTLCPEEGIYVQITTDIRHSAGKILDAHVHTQQLHPLARLMAERRQTRYANAMWWQNILCVHVPLVFSNKSKKAEPAKAEFDGRDRTIRSMKDFVGEHFQNTFGLRVEPMSGAEAWKAVFSQLNPFHPLDNIPDPILPGRESFLTYPPVDLSNQLLVSDRFDSRESMRDPEGHYDVITLDNLPPDWMSPMAISSLLGKIDFPLRVSLSAHVIRQGDSTRQLEKRTQFANIFSGRRKFAAVRNAEHTAGIRQLFDGVAKTGARIVRFGLTITIWDKSFEEMNRKASCVQATICGVLKNAQFFREIYQRPRAYVGGVSGFPQKTLRWKWGTGKTAGNLFPVLGPMVGTMDSPRMIFGNRWNSVSCLDIFSSRMNRWAFCIIAPTGSGKSVLANYIVQSSLSAAPKPFIVVFDMATMSSYEPLMEAFGGQCVNLSYDRSQSANVFDFRLGFEKPPRDHMAFMEETLSSMLAERGAYRLRKEEESLLLRAITRTYQRLLEEGPKQIPQREFEGIKHFRGARSWVEAREQWLRKAEEASRRGFRDEVMRCQRLALKAHREAMPVLSDLAAALSTDQTVLATSHDRDVARRLRRRLDTYIDGPAAMLFNQPTHLELDGNLTCINLGFVKDKQEHLASVFMILRRHIWMEAVYLDEGIPPRMLDILGREHYLYLQQRMKLVLYDEFHNFRDNATILRMIDKDARQQRTLGMAWGIITQSLRDLVFESEDLKINLATSVAGKFLLRHASPDNPQEMEIRYVKEKLGLNDNETRLLESLVLSPGEYSELMVFAEGVGRGVVRLSLQPPELWLYTTHKNERYVRDALVREIELRSNFSRSEALSKSVNLLAERYPKGIRDWNSEKIVLDELVAHALSGSAKEAHLDAAGDFQAELTAS
jgi:hypothetical protein